MKKHNKRENRNRKREGGGRDTGRERTLHHTCTVPDGRHLVRFDMKRRFLRLSVPARRNGTKRKMTKSRSKRLPDKPNDATIARRVRAEPIEANERIAQGSGRHRFCPNNTLFRVLPSNILFSCKRRAWGWNAFDFRLEPSSFR